MMMNLMSGIHRRPLLMSMCLTILLVTASHAEMPAELVLYLSFDDDSSDVIEDLSGNGNHGENHDAQPVEGIHGMALEYSGATTWVSVADAPDLNFGEGEAFTAICWAKTMGPPSGQGNILAKYDVNGGTTPFYGMFHNSNNQVHAYIRDGGEALLDLWSQDAINDDEWHHLALVRDTNVGDLYLYVDGNLDSEGSDPSGDTSNDLPLVIGRHNGGEFLVGMVDEVMLFRRALSADEVIASMTPSKFLAVRSAGKLAITWSQIRSE